MSQNIHDEMEKLCLLPHELCSSQQVVRRNEVVWFDQYQDGSVIQLHWVVARITRSRVRGPYARFCERDDAGYDHPASPYSIALQLWNHAYTVSTLKWHNLAGAWGFSPIQYWVVGWAWIMSFQTKHDMKHSICMRAFGLSLFITLS